MRGRVMSVAAAMAVVTAVVGVSGAGSLDAIVTSYLEIHAQLAADKIEAVKTPAGAIAARAAEMGKDGEALVKAAKAVEQASDLEAARKAFGPLSDAVIAAAKAQGWKGMSDVKLAYCPMANQSWLQKDQEIRNPYYGLAMLSCGEFRETKK